VRVRLAPVMRSVKLPVDDCEVDVMATGELPAPPGGGVIGVGKANVTPDGAFPTHEAVNVTGKLNPSRDVTITVVDPLSP
jgi:hypothetical protein